MRFNQYYFFFSSRRRHTRCSRDWSSDVCSSDLVRRRQRFDRPKQGALTIVTVGVGQERDDGLVVGSRVHTGERKQRLDLRCKDERAGRHGIVEGLDAQSIAGAEQPAPRAVPDGEGKHAVEAGEAAFPPMAVGLQQHFGVGPGRDRKSTRLNSSHGYISYAVFCLKKKKKKKTIHILKLETASNEPAHTDV